MNDLKIVLWNSGGLRAEANSTALKMAFFDKEYKHTNFDIAAFVETHHKDTDKFPQEISDYFSHYHVLHTHTTKTHKYAGIIVLISKRFQITQSTTLIPGRLLNIKIQHTATKTDYNISTIYGIQNTSARKNQVLELMNIFNKNHNVSENNIILGDFNFCDGDIDRTSGITKGDKIYAKPWAGLLNNLVMYDPYRKHFPNKIMYSFIHQVGKSRVIRAYLSENSLNKVAEQEYTPTPFTNAHKIYSFKIIGEEVKGRGYWKMNISILKDRAYKKMMEETLENLAKQEFRDPKEWWRIFIRCIRSKTIGYCSRKKGRKEK